MTFAAQIVNSLFVHGECLKQGIYAIWVFNQVLLLVSLVAILPRLLDFFRYSHFFWFFWLPLFIRQVVDGVLVVELEILHIIV